eukprot:9286816-Pyramimonas_sp.AAC.1
MSPRRPRDGPTGPQDDPKRSAGSVSFGAQHSPNPFAFSARPCPLLPAALLGTTHARQQRARFAMAGG